MPPLDDYDHAQRLHEITQELRGLAEELGGLGGESAALIRRKLDEALRFSPQAPPAQPDPPAQPEG